MKMDKEMIDRVLDNSASSWIGLQLRKDKNIFHKE